MIKRIIIVSTVLALVGLMVGCSEFLSGPESTTNPNIAAEVSVNELIVAIRGIVRCYGLFRDDVGAADGRREPALRGVRPV